MSVQAATTVSSAPSAGIAGTATKGFIASHPVGVALLAAVLVGAGAYYAYGKYFKKNNASDEEVDEPAASA